MPKSGREAWRPRMVICARTLVRLDTHVSRPDPAFNYAPVEFDLRTMYVIGEGIELYGHGGAYWLTLAAAKKGSPQAEWVLGGLCERGPG